MSRLHQRTTGACSEPPRAHLHTEPPWPRRGSIVTQVMDVEPAAGCSRAHYQRLVVVGGARQPDAILGARAGRPGGELGEVAGREVHEVVLLTAHRHVQWRTPRRPFE